MSIDINKRTKGEYISQKNELSRHGEMLIRINELIIARVQPEATETDEELEANAAFIVTACNNHDKLIEALKNVIARCEFELEGMKVLNDIEFVRAKQLLNEIEKETL